MADTERVPMLEAMADEDASGGKLVDALTRAVPMRRLGEPEDVAAAVAFFASDAAGYVTGQTLLGQRRADHGLSAPRPRLERPPPWCSG